MQSVVEGSEALPLVYVVLDRFAGPAAATICAGSGGLAEFLWQKAKTLDGLRAWMRRVAFQAQPPAPGVDPWRVLSRQRDQRQRKRASRRSA